MRALALLLLAAGCYGGAVEPAPPSECSAGIATLDPTPGDCVVIRDNPLTPGCRFQVASEERYLEPSDADVVSIVSNGTRLYLMNAEVTYGPLAPGERCSCSYVSRSR